MKMILLNMLVVALFASTNAYCEMYSEAVNLPIYPPAMKIIDSSGDLLVARSTPSGFFADMKVKIAYVSHTTKEPWIPRDMNDAGAALREVLPEEYYNRLLETYDKNGASKAEVDGPVFERIGDVARFLNEKWGLGWTSEKDPLKALLGLVRYSRLRQSDAADRCRK